MKRNINVIFSLGLLIVLLLTACEVPRPGGTDIVEPPPEVGVTPIVTTEGTAVPPVVTVPITSTTALPPTSAAPGLQVADIEPQGVEAPPEPVGFEPGTVILKLEEQASIQARSAELGADNIVTAGIDTLDQRLRDLGASGLDPLIEDVADVVGEDLNSFSIQAEDMSQLYVVSFPENLDPVQVATTLEEDPTVEYAEPNFIAGIAGEPGEIPVQLQPNDPYYIYQWGLPAIQMPQAWDQSTGPGVIVAIVDTGVDFRAPDLAGTNRLDGYDFVNNDAEPVDDHGHGTHVAGTVAQTTNNNLGVAGVAFGATVLPVKTLASNGNGTYDAIIKGIVYAVDQGAKVINMSLAGREGTRALRDAVEYAHSRGVVVIAAAGNSNGPVAYPAAYDGFVIAVGATRIDNARAGYSNFGPEIDIMAPGGDIEIDQNNDGYGDGIIQQTISSTGSGYSYRFFEGTSMASPHVAGAAALILSRKPSASPDEITNLLTQTALNIGPTNEFGAGLLQTSSALSALGLAPTPATDTPTPLPVPATDTPTPIPAAATDTPTAEAVDEHEAEIPTATPTQTPSPTVAVSPSPTAIPVPGATDTPTPGPGPLAGNELVVNGGFESNEGWVFGDTPVRGDYDTTVALSGSRSARLGITSGRDRYSFTSVWQRVTLPAEANQVVLTAHIYPISQDQIGIDSQNILILNERFRVIETLARELSNSQTWETRSYDLSHLRGQTIYIYFGVVNAGFNGRTSAMYVDDASETWAQ
jgi:serine protease